MGLILWYNINVCYKQYLSYIMKFPKRPTLKFPVIKLPIVDVNTDPLDLFLAGLVLRMKQLANHDPNFMALIYEKQCCIQISVKNGISRQIFFQKGLIDTTTDTHRPADLTIEFDNSTFAIKTFVQGTPRAFLQGVQQEKIQMQGDFSLLMWFSQLAKFIPPTLPPTVQQKISQVQTLWQKKRKK